MCDSRWTSCGENLIIWIYWYRCNVFWVPSLARLSPPEHNKPNSSVVALCIVRNELYYYIVNSWSEADSLINAWCVMNDCFRCFICHRLTRFWIEHQSPHILSDSLVGQILLVKLPCPIPSCRLVPSMSLRTCVPITPANCTYWSLTSPSCLII